MTGASLPMAGRSSLQKTELRVRIATCAFWISAHTRSLNSTRIGWIIVASVVSRRPYDRRNSRRHSRPDDLRPRDTEMVAAIAKGFRDISRVVERCPIHLFGRSSNPRKKWQTGEYCRSHRLSSRRVVEWVDGAGSHRHPTGASRCWKHRYLRPHTGNEVGESRAFRFVDIAAHNGVACELYILCAPLRSVVLNVSPANRKLLLNNCPSQIRLKSMSSLSMHRRPGGSRTVLVDRLPPPGTCSPKWVGLRNHRQYPLNSSLAQSGRTPSS